MPENNHVEARCSQSVTKPYQDHKESPKATKSSPHYLKYNLVRGE